MLYRPTVTYKHRKWNRQDVPSWGDEGYTVTPIYFPEGSGLGLEWKRIESGLIELPIPSEIRQFFTIPKVKSTLLIKRVQITCVGSGYVVLEDIDRIIHDEYVGGIISIARFTDGIKPDKETYHKVSLEYVTESGNIHPMCRLLDESGNILKLDSDYLHEMSLNVSDDGWIISVPTAWVDPGFDGTLFVPFHKSCTGRLFVNSWRYTGENRYEGYQGEDRLHKR